MIAPGNNVIQLLFAVAFVIAAGYALGRIHQWRRDGTDRDAAYRTGYDRASDRLIESMQEAPDPLPVQEPGLLPAPEPLTETEPEPVSEPLLLPQPMLVSEPLPSLLPLPVAVSESLPSLPVPVSARSGGHESAVTVPVRPGRRHDRRPVGDFRRRIGPVPAARSGRENAAR